ncbi:hypothetical protein EB796_019712 [Bugula neritina]|uniref:NADP-dependent oxidoreductase domain-containing protein n=1 Tax=Bugula neritina TaxID=10212 RepID=A0A7J7J7H7_BUGNE|nr:hypothetical protein EB796_019712 [Bugula neritina]
MADTKVPVLTFNNGLTMPQLGYGTWKSKPEEVTEAVKMAIDAGYRHIDCAYCYGNEKEVGAGIKAKIDDGTVKREDLFITGKLWNTFHRRELVDEACQLSLDDLGLEYLDLYLIHWPYGYKEGHFRFPKDENGKFIYSDGSYVDTYKGMEDLVDSGKVKSIGISNFNHQQLQEIVDAARIKPASHQIEHHPYLKQDKLLAYCKERDITVTAHGSIGSRDRPWVTDNKEEHPNILEDPKVLAVAEKHGKTPAQVFDFELTAEDMSELNSFPDKRYRGVELAWIGDHPLYPFHLEF